MEQHTHTVSPNAASTISSEDFAYMLGYDHKYTWDEFYEMMELERNEGKTSCPQASYIALDILTPQLMQLPWRSVATNSETHKDYIQDAYKVIAENICNYDRSKSSFKTYIMKWFQGLARETRNNGITDYQQKKGYKVLSTDAIVSSNTFDYFATGDPDRNLVPIH